MEGLVEIVFWYAIGVLAAMAVNTGIYAYGRAHGAEADRNDVVCYLALSALGWVYVAAIAIFAVLCLTDYICCKVAARKREKFNWKRGDEQENGTGVWKE